MRKVLKMREPKVVFLLFVTLILLTPDFYPSVTLYSSKICPISLAVTNKAAFETCKFVAERNLLEDYRTV